MDIGGNYLKDAAIVPGGFAMVVTQNIGGNVYDKYNSRNPVARWFMDGFLADFDDLVGTVAPRSAFEIGCGEGMLSLRLLGRGIDMRGIDVEGDIVDAANALCRDHGHGDRFVSRSLYSIGPAEIRADLIVCCEVLEHVPDPAEALRIIAAQAAGHVLLSAPREPLWRVLNVARGRYLPSLGNTPGHINHWSRNGLRRLVEEHFEIVALRSPLPWTMILCRPRPWTAAPNAHDRPQPPARRAPSP